MECPVSEFPHVTNLKLSERIEFPDEVVGKVTGKGEILKFISFFCIFLNLWLSPNYVYLEAAI